MTRCGCISATSLDAIIAWVGTLAILALQIPVAPEGDVWVLRCLVAMSGAFLAGRALSWAQMRKIR